MSVQVNPGSQASFTNAQLQNLWEKHMRCELHHITPKIPSDTLATMVEDAYVNHIPMMAMGDETWY